MRERKRIFTVVLFIVYAGVMVWLLFLQRSRPCDTAADYASALRYNTNFTPLRTINELWWLFCNSTNRYLVGFAAVNLIGNAAAFIPAGYLMPAIWKRMRRFWLFLPTVTLIIVLIEAVQLFTLLGSCDIDDLILNLPGALIGWVIYALTHRRKQ